MGGNAWHFQRTPFEEHYRAQNNSADCQCYMYYVSGVGRAYAGIREAIEAERTSSVDPLLAGDWKEPSSSNTPIRTEVLTRSR
jgi:hypothetical protein